MRCFFTLIFDEGRGAGGGGVNLIIPILFVKIIKILIRLCTVLIFFLSCSFEDMGIFHVFQLSFDGGGDNIYPYQIDR